MTNKFALAVVAGIVATAVMTGVGIMTPFIGLPRMNPAEMLSAMLNVSIIIGYILHFMIGIIFASAYVYYFNDTVKINSKFLKGAVFGITVFIFAQIILLLIGMIMPMPAMEGNMVYMMVASIIGHLVYGIVVGWIVPLSAPATTVTTTDMAGQH